MFAAELSLPDLVALVVGSAFWAGLLGGVSGTFVLMLVGCLFRMWGSRHDR